MPKRMPGTTRSSTGAKRGGTGRGMRHEFPVVVVREGREYWAYVPDLPGVYGRGRTAAGAKKDITDALTLYIEDCLA